MRAKDSKRLDAIRLLWAAIQRREVDERIELDDEGVLAVIQKLVKQSHDAISQFQAGKRPDLVAKEQTELAVFTGYLPEPLSDDDVNELIRAVITETGAASMRDMGKVMAGVKTRLKGRADMALVSSKHSARHA